MSTTLSEQDAADAVVVTQAQGAPKKKAEPRPYVVLRNVTEKATSPGGAQPQTWEFVRNVDATSADQALRKVTQILVAASEDASFSGTLVAIPVRNFRPEPVSIEVTTHIKIG